MDWCVCQDRDWAMWPTNAGANQRVSIRSHECFMGWSTDRFNKGVQKCIADICNEKESDSGYFMTWISIYSINFCYSSRIKPTIFFCDVTFSSADFNLWFPWGEPNFSDCADIDTLFDRIVKEVSAPYKAPATGPTSPLQTPLSFGACGECCWLCPESAWWWKFFRQDLRQNFSEIAESELFAETCFTDFDGKGWVMFDLRIGVDIYE